MSLFKSGKFTSHAGIELLWKIECDALTDEDWATLAFMVAEKFRFRTVEGIPTGGLKFAKALSPYLTYTSLIHLIVDDVWTTGKSMRETKQIDNVIGVVAFARGPLTDEDREWVMPMWSAAEWLHF